MLATTSLFHRHHQNGVPCPFFGLLMVAGMECAQKQAVKDFVTGGCAEICFSLFLTRIKKLKDTLL